MMSKCSLLIAALAAAIWPGQSNARDVPIEVRWRGTPPNEVRIKLPGGPDYLEPIPGPGRFPTAGMFRGNLSVSGPADTFEIAVQYGNYDHQFHIRVLSNFRWIRIPISHTTQISCTERLVEDANTEAETLEQAIDRSVDAGELFHISGDNACDDELRVHVLRARVTQMREMDRSSGGMYLVDNYIDNLRVKAEKDWRLQSQTKNARFANRGERQDKRQRDKRWSLMAYITGG
jgi:hypothetical protein